MPVGREIKPGSALVAPGAATVLAIAACLAACGGNYGPEPPPARIAHVDPTVTDRCPVIAITLMVDTSGPDSETTEVIALDAGGDVRVALVALAGNDDPIASFDPRGCLVGPDGVWIDRTTGDAIWTLRGSTTIADGRFFLGTGRSIEISADGHVVAFDAQGAREPGDWGTLRFEGYRPQARCAAQLLLMAYFSMIPSMAVSDGNPPVQAPPADSACPELHALNDAGPTP